MPSAAVTVSDLQTASCRMAGWMLGCIIIGPHPTPHAKCQQDSGLRSTFFFFVIILLLRLLLQSLAMSGAWVKKNLVCVMVTWSWLWLSGNVRQASKFPLPAFHPPHLATCETTLELLAGQSKRCSRWPGMCLHRVPASHASPLLVLRW